MRTVPMSCCFIVYLLTAFLFIDTSSAYGKKNDGVFFRRYVVIDGSGLPAMSKEALAVYDGVEFPVYCGYVTFYPDRTVTFTKKTELPIIGIVEFFDGVEKGKVSIWSYGQFLGAIKRDGEVAQDATTEDELFQDIVLERMRYTYSLFTVERQLYNLPPDENFSPKFTETCIFNSKSTPPQRCDKMNLSDTYIKQNL